VGIPFPNVMAPKVKTKRSFMDALKQEHAAVMRQYNNSSTSTSTSKSGKSSSGGGGGYVSLDGGSALSAGLAIIIHNAGRTCNSHTSIYICACIHHTSTFGHIHNTQVCGGRTVATRRPSDFDRV
jgi:hypothetical protein